MPRGNEEVAFSFSWLALKLLGRGLYSNPWSALSELVANGFDAGATTVHVYVDARNKADAVVEVIDDGIGMGREALAIYAQVGYNKREHASASGEPTADRPMGRKGIGKLAALFLSQHFFLRTRHAGSATAWELDARDGRVQDDENPALRRTDAAPSTENDRLWARARSGTRITLMGVDLTGYGEQSIKALGHRLANQFLLPTDGPPKILLWVRTADRQDGPAYKRVEKSVAFGNLAAVAQRFPDTSTQPVELAQPAPRIAIPAKGIPGEKFRHTQTRSHFPADPPEDEAWDQISELVDPSNRTYKGVKYSLCGWIGVHATIENDAAHENDKRFMKNKYYNPAQIRVYVRGKLASDRLLSQLGITGTYANYIEGEISFDLLDDDRLPDIATSNRQDFDETDSRVTLLRALVRPIVRQLIQRRNVLASEIAAQTKQEKDRRDAASKKNFSEQVGRDLAQYPDIPTEVQDHLQMVITNKIEGDVSPKSKYRVFISHSKADACFARLIDEILRARGAATDEIFFTSRVGAIDNALDERSLGTVIKESITDANTLIFYLTSRNFLRSEFCMFEGGAGWATRAVTEYLKLNVDFESIPKFLTNGKAEVLLMSSSQISLTPDLHNYLIAGVLNPMIAHLNRGREISGAPAIAPFAVSHFPSPVELDFLGKAESDYYDPIIVQHWNVIVSPEVDAYLKAYDA